MDWFTAQKSLTGFSKKAEKHFCKAVTDMVIFSCPHMGALSEVLALRYIKCENEQAVLLTPQNFGDSKFSKNIDRKSKRERPVLINRNNHRDNQTFLTLRFSVELFGETRNVDTVRSQRRTDRRARSRLARRQLQFYDCCYFLSHNIFSFVV